MALLTVSPSPHVHGEYSIKKLMYGVVLAMMPALVVSIYYFGVGAIIVTSVAVLSCLIFEFLIQKYLMKVPTTYLDGSALITGLLLAFNLPANLPVWIVIVGSLVAIGIGKLSFGGLGYNIFNPALVGRVFLLISFPVQMTTWPVPRGFNTSYSDAVTGATPLGFIKERVKEGKPLPEFMDQVPDHMELFLGHMKGSMGEVAAFALILGFIYMIWRKIITWHIPVSILLTIAVFTGILWWVNPDKYLDPLFHLLTGGVMLGAIFMATDYVTSPMTIKGKWIFGIGIGVITVLIRVFGAYPEGISFAILIMNAFVPLMNQYIKPRPFGKELRNG